MAFQLPRALRPFRAPDYRILAISMVVSLFGAGMWAVAMVYEVIALGGGPVDLSIVGTATSLGLIAAALFGGVAADLLPKRAILRTVEGLNVVAIGASALLSALGLIEVWHLAVSGCMLGVAAGFFFPAYSAILPRILPAADLLAANGIEAAGRPVLQYAAGPAAAGALVAAWSPGDAIGWIAACHAVAFATLWFLHPRVDEREPGTVEQTGVRLAWHSVREGVAYTVRTPWLRWTLVWSVVIVFLFVGPFEVLTPFVLGDLSLGAEAFGLVLASNGAGAALGALVIASRPLPRRYFTVMVVAWASMFAPLAVLGIATELWHFCLASLAIGIGGGIGNVIWGTLLQRRVPTHMLGRISSLDFFVSLALMPVSMAVVGPIAVLVDPATIFIAAGAGIAAVTVLVWWVAGFGREELRHPLADDAPEPLTVSAGEPASLDRP